MVVLRQHLQACSSMEAALRLIIIEKKTVWTEMLLVTRETSWQSLHRKTRVEAATPNRPFNQRRFNSVKSRSARPLLRPPMEARRWAELHRPALQ